MHVAVLGAGYAGISIARRLERSLPDADEITVVDERDTHLVQHLVHRVIRYPSLAEDLTIPIAELLDRADHRQARVTGLDPDSGRVDLSDGSLRYDAGVVALGAQTAFYDLPGVEEHATPCKRLHHAEQIRSEAHAVCETGGRIVVGGAGLAGVQVAGELAAMAATADPEVEIVLLEALDSVAPAFPQEFQRVVADELRDSGVVIRTGTAVEGADDEAVSLADGESVAYDAFVWTGGIAGQDAVDGERPQVRADLRLGDRTFAVGDAVRVVDANGEPAPPSAQTAVRQAGVAAENVRRVLDEHDGAGFRPRLDRYRYDELGWMVSIGDATVAQVGPSILRGPAAKALKTTVGAGYLGSVDGIRRAADYVWEAVGEKDGAESAESSP
jgi:NADH dehydrogenase